MQRKEREAGKIADGVASGLSVAFWSAVIFGVAVVVWGLLFPRIGGPSESAPHARSGTAVRNIVNALKSYQHDYGHFPEIGKPLPDGKRMIFIGDPACKISSGPNSLLFDVLRAIPHGANVNHALNPHQQKYFEMGKAKDSKVPRDGFADGPEFPELLQGCLFDPWGRQYCVVFTMDDSGTIDLSAVYSDLASPEHLIRSPVAALPPMSAKMSGRLTSFLARQGRHPRRERLRRQVPQARCQRRTGRHRLVAVGAGRTCGR
jgi:hypothetical protein